MKRKIKYQRSIAVGPSQLWRHVHEDLRRRVRNSAIVSPFRHSNRRVSAWYEEQFVSIFISRSFDTIVHNDTVLFLESFVPNLKHIYSSKKKIGKLRISLTNWHGPVNCSKMYKNFYEVCTLKSISIIKSMKSVPPWQASTDSHRRAVEERRRMGLEKGKGNTL